MPSPAALLIRDAQAADLPAITAIYREAVLTGSASFELEAPDLPEMTRRHAELRARGGPWLVADQAGQVLGYAYAGPFRPRPAYRFAVEDSVYLHDHARGRGLGRLLLAELIARCETAGARQMLAVIGDSANLASIGLHRSLGFAPAGVLRDVGRKFDRWLDVVMMQRPLGPGAASAPGTAAADISPPA